jgi:hypothetical protein
MNPMVDSLSFKQRLSNLADKPSETLSSILERVGFGPTGDGFVERATSAQVREHGRRLEMISKEILERFCHGCDKARDATRIAYLRKLYKNDYTIANALGIDRSGVSRIRKYGVLTKTTRSRFDAKYGSRVSLPIDDEIYASGYIEAINYAREVILREQLRSRLCREGIEYLITVSSDNKWSNMLRGIGQVSHLVAYGENLIKSVRTCIQHLGPPWIITNSFNLASITIDWLPSFLLVHHLVWEEIAEPD